MNPPKSDVVGTPISTTSYDEVLGLLAVPPADRARTVAFCNVHSVMTARRDPGLRVALDAFDVATPDGVPLVWTLRLTGHHGQQRVYGPDCMELAFALPGLRHYLYGATEQTLALLQQRIAERWPAAQVVGAQAPPFRAQSPDEEAADLAAIRASGADVVWVGLGMPKQERWIHRVAGQLPGTTVLGVGAAFDFLAGTVDQAPDRLQRLGLEWAYRLAKEPRRLWKRYAVNNPLFVLALLRQLLAGRRRAPREGEVRVLQVLHELQPSGAETCLRIAAPMLAKEGIAVTALATGPQLGPYAGALQEAGVATAHLPLDPFGRFVPRFLAFLRAGRYDAVHVHVERGNFYLALLLRLAGVRTILHSLHSVFDFGGALRLQRTIQRAVMRLLGVRFVAVSEQVRDDERRRFRNRATVVRNFFDVERFTVAEPDERAAARAALDVPAGTFAVACVGNCSAVKNHAALLRGLARLEGPWLLLHAGSSDEEPAERALAASLGLGGRLRFLGQVDDVPQVLAAADCYVMPSTIEGLGIAALEALARGTPAVLSDTTGLTALKSLALPVEWVAPHADAITGALARVAATAPEERLARGRAAAQRVRDAYGPDQPVAWLAAAYRGRRSVDPSPVARSVDPSPVVR